MPIVAPTRLCFGPFTLDTRSGELYKHDLKLKLHGHPIQILQMLLERHGEVVTRDEIRQKLWPAESETFVDFEHGLNTAVRKLRQVLGDEAEEPKYIETLPKRGYRFVGEIAADTSQQQQRSASLTPFGQSQTIEVTEGAPSSIESTQSADALRAGHTITPEQEAHPGRLSYRPLVLFVLLPVILGYAAWVLRPHSRTPAALKVVGTKQLTFSASVGYEVVTPENYRSIQTDGRRIYYTHNDATLAELRSVSVSGGDETAIKAPVFYPVILHISPDGAYLLVRDFTGPEGTSEAALWLVETNSGTARPIGDVTAQDAAFAPDGKTIAVAKGQALYLTDLQGVSPVKLVDVPGHAFWLRWSPDGQRIRFSVLDPKSSRFTIWELGTDRKLIQVLKHWKEGVEVCCGIWTGDGKFFLFSSNSQYWAIPDPVRGADRPEPLTAGGLVVSSAATNPLGHEVFVSAAMPSSTGFRWDLRTGEYATLYPQLQATRVEFSPDGKLIAYSRLVGTAKELWVAKVDGTEKRQIVGGSYYAFMAHFSPDSQKIVFMVRAPDAPWKIYWASVSGGAWHAIPEPPVNQADPNWSPDGNSILFGQPPDFYGEPGVPRHLYLHDLRTGKTTEIPGSAGFYSPRWSPNGKHVASMRIEGDGLAIMDFATFHMNQPVKTNVDNPFWSSDSAWVYFNGGEHLEELVRTRVASRAVERVALKPLPANYSSCWAHGFAADGTVLVSCSDLRRNIFALELK